MAQQVRCLPWEGSSDSQKPHKKPGGLGGLPVIPASDQTQGIPGASQTNQMNWPDQEDRALKPASASETLLQKGQSEQEGHSTSTLDLHMHGHTCAHTHANKHTGTSAHYTHIHTQRLLELSGRQLGQYVQGPEVKKEITKSFPYY